jgi:hypothetical protein
MKPVHSFLYAVRTALQWRLLMLWTGLLLVPTLVMAVPVWQLLGGALDHSVHASALARKLDALAAFDLIAVFNRAGGMLGTAGILSLLLTLALSPLLSGMAVTAARTATPAGFGQLLTGAFSQYGRMVRMLVWSSVPLGAAVALGAWIASVIDLRNQSAIVESEAQFASMLGTAAAVLLFALATATVDAGRAVLAAEPRRTSAVKGWWTGVRLVVRRPLATLGGWLGIAAVGLVLAAGCALLRVQLPPLGAGTVIAGLVLTQAAALCLAWSRQARLFALVALLAVPAPLRVSGIAVGEADMAKSRT